MIVTTNICLQTFKENIKGRNCKIQWDVAKPWSNFGIFCDHFYIPNYWIHSTFVIIFCIIFYYKLFISKNYWHKLKCYPFTPFSKNLWHTEKKDIEHVHSPSISLTAMTRSFLSANWKARLWPSVKAMLLNCIRNSAAILSVSCGSKLALYKRENVNVQEEVLLQINKKMNFIKKFTYI